MLIAKQPGVKDPLLLIEFLLELYPLFSPMATGAGEDLSVVDRRRYEDGGRDEGAGESRPLRNIRPNNIVLGLCGKNLKVVEIKAKIIVLHSS